MGDRSKPNVVFILADNVGWGDIGCYGGLAPTPLIDASPVRDCASRITTSRRSARPRARRILSGRLPIRTGNCSVPLPGQGHYGLAPWEYTLGELFSDAGYATAAFGKWHVGDIDGRLPTDQGFDEWFGIKNTSDESGYSSYPLFAESGFPVPKIWEGVKGSAVTPVEDFNLQTRPLLDEKIAARAAAFIKRNAEAGKPFFTYVCFTQMHPPLIHHPDFKGRSGGGVYSDTLAELDHRTGQVLDAIDQAGIAENTIVVWSSDNPAGRVDVDGRFERAVARSLRVRIRGRHARPGDCALARQGESRCGQRRDSQCGRLDADPGGVGRRAHAGARRSPDRRRRCFGVPARAQPDDRTRSCDLLRFRRRSDVGQVENDEGRVPVQREHQRSDHQATVALGVRPDRRPGRGVGSDREAPGLRLGVCTHRRASGVRCNRARLDTRTSSRGRNSMVTPKADPLPSWNDGTAKQAIVTFVSNVTKEGARDFVPVAERIATFDNDGTLWAEQPMYIQLLFGLDRIKELAPQHPEWKDKEPFKSVLAGDVKAAFAGGAASLVELMAAGHSNMTIEEFERVLSKWVDSAKHPTTGQPYLEMV